MRQRLTVLFVAVAWALLGAGSSRPAAAQKKPAPKTPVRRAAPLPAPVTEPAMLMCPNPLGDGVQTHRGFCDVLTGRDPKDGIIVTLPPHVGTATIMFDLHNRHMYSEELIRTNKAYRRYTASIGVLTMDNTLVSRAVVQSEFRTAADLVDRVGGGAGPGGVKAVAPTGTEPIAITIPEGEDRVSILGEKLTVERTDGTTTYSSPGRPIAVISNVMIEYRSAPAKPIKKRD